MTTHVTTRNPVRADLPTSGTPTPATRRPSNGWALAGVAAGVLGIGTMVSSSMINAMYDKSIALDEDAILARLADQSVQIITFSRSSPASPRWPWSSSRPGCTVGWPPASTTASSRWSPRPA